MVSCSFSSDKSLKVTSVYAKLKFALGKHETWANVGWALDELNIDVEDKDINILKLKEIF
jgi:outer membrane protein assembly factor BamC